MQFWCGTRSSTFIVFSGLAALLTALQSKTVFTHLWLPLKVKSKSVNDVEASQRSNTSSGSNPGSTGPALVKRNRTVFLCGYVYEDLARQLFPDYDSVEFYSYESQPTNESIILNGIFGPCPSQVVRDKLPEGFEGKLPTSEGQKWLHVNGESSWRETALIGNHFGLGPPAAGDDVVTPLGRRHVVHVTYMAIILMSIKPEQNRSLLIFNHSLKQGRNDLAVHDVEKQRFCIYVASNCVAFREEAADRLTEIGHVYQGGHCDGASRPSKLTRPSDAEMLHFNGMDWISNDSLLRGYRFCLVMENTNTKGYITEKILHAFLAGCIPIYYGTPEVLSIFNPRAFIYYDIQNPKPSLMRIQDLELNMSAYYQVMNNEPILLNGSQTINDYFSLTGGVGDGSLFQQIRQMLGISSPSTPL